MIFCKIIIGQFMRVWHFSHACSHSLTLSMLSPGMYCFENRVDSDQLAS